MIYEGKPAPLYLPGVENNPDVEGPFADLIRSVRDTGGQVSQIWHLFAFLPAATKHLERFTQGVMREPGPLSPGFRELIAAYTSSRNQCPF